VVFGALRSHVNGEEAQLDAALDAAAEALAPGGRLVVLTFVKWEVAALRRFLRDHEEPGPGAKLDAGGAAALSKAAALPEARLAELYPLLGTRKAYACRRVGPPRRPSPAELAANPRSKTALLHVIEKAPRRWAPVRRAVPETAAARSATSGQRGAHLAPSRFSVPSVCVQPKSKYG